MQKLKTNAKLLDRFKCVKSASFDMRAANGKMLLFVKNILGRICDCCYAICRKIRNFMGLQGQAPCHLDELVHLSA